MGAGLMKQIEDDTRCLRSARQSIRTDVVVVGAGASGLLAAIAASRMGLDVIVVEGADVIGGCSAYSFGMMWVPNSPAARRAGIRDDRNRVLEYLRGEMGERFEPTRAEIEAYLEHAPAMVEFLEDQCGIRFELRDGYPDYHCDRPGGSKGGRTILPTSFDARVLGNRIRHLRRPRHTILGQSLTPGEVQLLASRSGRAMRFLLRRFVRLARDRASCGTTTQLAGGSALVAQLYRAALERGIPVHRRAHLVALMHDGSRVSGVRLATPDAPWDVMATRAVILACGGFGRSATHADHMAGSAVRTDARWSLSPPGCDGDGIRLAQAQGGAVEADLHNWGFWAPASRPDQSGPMLSLHSYERFRPGYLAVTRQGRRFANEADANHHFCEALHAASPDHEQPTAWLICDRRALITSGLGELIYLAPLGLRRHLRSGYVIRRSSVRDLALALGIDPGTLGDTIERFNRDARSGVDTEFGKGSSTFNRVNGSPRQSPNPCLRPLDDGPLYAVPFGIAYMATLSGLRTDIDSRVLDAHGAPVPGLYATGGDRVNLFRGACPGGGITLGPGLTWSYLAARAIAAETGRTAPATRSGRQAGAAENALETTS